MSLGHGTYLAIDLLSLAGPFFYGFTAHSGFNRQWRHFLPALLFTAFVYILWDMAFTRMGVWGFNADYHLNWTLADLPLEEILFFLCIPFACLFLYDVAARLTPLHMRESWAKPLCASLALVCAGVALAHADRAYTVSAFGLAAFGLAALALGLLPGRTGHFLLAYAIHLLPFFLVNGLLTSLPVVIYNDAENLGLRLGTIPLEDSAYSLTLLLLNVFLYERSKS